MPRDVKLPPAAKKALGSRIGAEPDEEAFRTWYGKRADKLGLSPNPDDPRHHYDYRAARRAGAEPDSTGHWPSQFKRESHPTNFSNVKSGSSSTAPSSIFPLGSAEAIFKEDQKLFNKIGASKVSGLQNEIRQRYGNARTRNNDELAGSYLRRLARSLEADHKLDYPSALRAAERIIKDSIT